MIYFAVQVSMISGIESLTMFLPRFWNNLFLSLLFSLDFSRDCAFLGDCLSQLSPILNSPLKKFIYPNNNIKNKSKINRFLYPKLQNQKNKLSKKKKTRNIQQVFFPKSFIFYYQKHKSKLIIITSRDLIKNNLIMPRRGAPNEKQAKNTRGKPNLDQKNDSQDDNDDFISKNLNKSESWINEKVVKQQTKEQNGNTSIWMINDQDQKEEQTPQVSRRGKEILNTSICGQITDNQKEELQPDPHNTSWMPQNANTNSNKDNGDQEDDNTNEVKKRRGNRHEKQADGFSKKPSYFEDRDKKYNNDFNNNNYNQSYGQRNDYRGRGRGRGRGGYRNNIDNRSQPNTDNNYKYRDKQPKNDYFNQNKRDNPYPYNNNKYNNNYQKDPVQIDQANKPKRGNRFEPKTNSQYNRNSNYQQRIKDNRSNNYYQSGYNNHHQGGGNHSNSNNSNFNRQEPKVVEHKQKEKEKERSKDKMIVPKGRKCWPESSIYILGCKLSVTFRPLNQFKCKLLIIPYTTVSMEYYPGNLINSSEIDYRKKIVSKGVDIAGAGHVYMQKAIEIGNFTAVGFLKIDEKRKSDSLKIGIKEVLKLIQRKVEDTISLESLIFPICQKLGHIDIVVKTFLENLQEYRKIKQIYIISNSQKCFIQGMSAFTKEIQNLLNANQILIT